ncbi:MAG: winged helix-turn-helix domain-containing protein [Thermoplasmatales archaeon]|nr:winged helix-turn-helix domain-containing protein [Thermoplasmatales archaeon]
MNEIMKSFGHNAGELWETLSTEGPQVQTKLMNKTKLREDEFYGAIGWLARENKIFRNKKTYKIGETNLTEKIGSDAGKVWKTLGRNNEVDISSISRSAKIEKRDCYTALGWLAREGKITAKIKVKRK